MKKLEARLTRSPVESLVVGHLAEAERRVYFEYAPEFLRTGLQLSPFKLPSRPGAIEHLDRGFGPLPGLFEDSLPDAWGRLLLDRELRRLGMDPQIVSPLDRLAWLGTRTMGALTYHPPRELEPGDNLLDLPKLVANAQAVLAGEASQVLPALMRAGGSPGGTRPKVLVGLRGDEVISGEDDLPAGYEHWIVKFSARQDARDAGPIEYAYALMARAAGLDMPPVRLFQLSRTLSCFGVQRFDRGSGNVRFHVHTFAGLIHADYRVPANDYVDLFKVVDVLTHNHADKLRAFRTMAFNVAAHNRDDHVKNFAFIMDREGAWSLAPAYDLIYAHGPGGEHTMTILGEGRQPTREHCMALARRFLVRDFEAEGILEQVNTAMGKWPQLADQAGCTKKTARQIVGHLTQL